MSEALDKVRGVRELPLFPLPVVLFPGMPMPLHIFEDRYRQMLADVRAGNNLFALSYFDSSSSEEDMPSAGHVGCVAEVAETQAELLLLAVGEPLRLPVWVAAFFCGADLRFASGSAFDRAFEPPFDALRVRPPGTLNTTSSLFPRCSTCAVAPGCSRNETTVPSTVFCAFTSAKPRPRTVSARGTSLCGILT